MKGQGRRPRGQSETEKSDAKTPSSHESPTDVMRRVSDEVVKEIKEIFEKKDQKKQ